MRYVRTCHMRRLEVVVEAVECSVLVICSLRHQSVTICGPRPRIHLGRAWCFEAWLYIPCVGSIDCGRNTLRYSNDYMIYPSAYRRQLCDLLCPVGSTEDCRVVCVDPGHPLLSAFIAWSMEYR